ncbi:GNAT family acetyltransferase [Roridomyces roridus]|uniref:GNAT family acetyltransferase n=1 Tax=Roridomyces roridus TaxID=1738132 RepID=A0AAD7C5W1_9AGAR|nr:GNAT family acetyltransferase [Roridomyces roridus]
MSLAKFAIPDAGIESSRVRLTLYEPLTHNNQVLAQFSAHPELGRWLPAIYSPEVLQELFDDPNGILLAVTDKPTGRLAGVIGLGQTSFRDMSTEIGPVICFPEFQRTYVTSHAVAVLLRHCLDLPSEAGGMGFRRVQWKAHSMNVASVKAAERMGFKMEGTLRWTHVLPPGREGQAAGRGRGEALGRDSCLLAICWDDWESGGRELVQKVLDRTS